MNLLVALVIHKKIEKTVKTDYIFLLFSQHVVKAPCAGYVEGLKATAGQQVFDSSVLFTVKVRHNY